MKRRGSLLLIMSLLLLTAVPLSARGEESAPGPIRIGVYLPMTGPLAYRGQTVYAGLRIAHMIQPTVLGREVELLLVDTAQEGVGTVGAVTDLMKEKKVDALIGEPSVKDALKGISIAEKAGKPSLLLASASSLATEGKGYAFRMGLTNSIQGKAVAQYAAGRLKTKKAALIMDIDQGYSMDLAHIFMNYFSERGGKVVAIAYCRTGDTVFTTQLSSIMAAKPDVLYLPLSHREVALVCRQAADGGLHTHIISSSHVHTPALIETGGSAVEGIILPDYYDRRAATADIAAVYIDRYEKETGQQTGPFDVLGADAYFLLIDAVRRADSSAGAAVRKALAETEEFGGVSGRMNMSEEGNVLKDIILLKIQGGEYQYLETVPYDKERGPRN